MALAFEYYFPQVLNCNSNIITIEKPVFPNPIGYCINRKNKKNVDEKKVDSNVTPCIDFYEIELENKIIGIIIGVGGATIQKIRKDSGATIKIYDEIKDGKRKIKITGDIKCMNIAKEKIMNRISN